VPQGHAKVCVRRLLDLIAHLSPEHNLFTNQSPADWQSLPSAVTWTSTCVRTTPTTSSSVCLTLRKRAVTLLRDLASAPCAAAHVQDALLEAFTALCTCNKAQAAVALAPALAVGGALDALFLRENVSEDAKYAVTLLRDDVMDAFLRACDVVLAAEWGRMSIQGETMRARMIKALWEILASQVCALCFVRFSVGCEYVGVYVDERVYIYICVCACMYVCMYVCMYARSRWLCKD
jgi:hypothetical protein